MFPVHTIRTVNDTRQEYGARAESCSAEQEPDPVRKVRVEDGVTCHYVSRSASLGPSGSPGSVLTDVREPEIFKAQYYQTY